MFHPFEERSNAGFCAQCPSSPSFFLRLQTKRRLGKKDKRAMVGNNVVGGKKEKAMVFFFKFNRNRKVAHRQGKGSRFGFGYFFLGSFFFSAILCAGAASSLWAQAYGDPPYANEEDGGETYRVLALEEQVRSLVGQVEVLTHRVDQLQRQLEGLKASAPPTGPQGALPVAPPVPLASQPPLAQIPDHTISPGNYAIMEVDAPLPPQAAGQKRAQKPQTPAPGPQILGTLPGSDRMAPLGALPPSSAKPSGAVPEVLYEEAYAAYAGGRNQEAQAKFSDFVARYAAHAYAGRAYYWLGELAMKEGNQKEGARYFLLSYQTDPKGPKGADTLYRLGVSLVALEQKKQACGAFSEVLRKYPKAGDVRRKALSELKALGCS